MHKSFSVLCSDQVNKYGYLLTLPALEDGMWLHATEGGVPMHFGHDMHRPIGRMIPFGMYFKPGLVRSIGISLMAESDEEYKNTIDFKNYLIEKYVHEALKENAEFLPHIKEKLEGDVKFIKASTIAAINADVVKRLFPDLLSKMDKDGLLYLKDLRRSFTYKSQGVFFHNELPLCIYVHSYFRRSLSRHNSFHYIFLDELMTHDNNEDVTLRIALDWDLIGYSPDFLGTMEFEYWFGPKFNNDISAIAPGLTTHNTSEFERQYYGLSSTEFYWKNNEQLKEFELEELRENEAPTIENFYGCRYIHSIYDTEKETFVHFDGAIRGYDSELYMDRISQKMTEFGRRSTYKKIFRVDGKLDLKDWKSLTTNYMQGNPLMYEYFGIEQPKSTLDEPAIVKTLMEELVPHKMEPTDGFRLLVSYHKKNEDFKDHSHVVSIYDVVETDDGEHDILESDIIEVKKALSRLEKGLYIKEDVLFGSIKDEYWNIPCIFHSSETPQEDIEITLQALRNIFEKHVQRGHNTIISFTIGWNFEDKEVRISCCGHVNELNNWLDNCTFPYSRDEIRNWIDVQRTYLNDNYGITEDVPDIATICQFDGILYFKRKIVDKKYKLIPKANDIGLTCSFTIPDNSIYYSDLKEFKIRPTMGYILTNSICSKTGDDYAASPYSKILDDDVYMTVADFKNLAFYWTDKPIY